MSQYRKEHRQYFESDAGQELLKALTEQIDLNHTKAENVTSRDESFAYTQRASGIRDSLDVINSMTAGGKKPE